MDEGIETRTMDAKQEYPLVVRDHKGRQWGGGIRAEHVALAKYDALHIAEVTERPAEVVNRVTGEVVATVHPGEDSTPWEDE